ncbi:hypothetical protein J7I89_13270 [Arthrobacter sp. ISL-5]|nr:hypothetical protein [Arthrobacter sp. ISL-5]
MPGRHQFIAAVGTNSNLFPLNPTLQGFELHEPHVTLDSSLVVRGSTG